MIDALQRLVAGDDDREHLDSLNGWAGKGDEDKLCHNVNQQRLKGIGAQTA